eukprot:CAMPEP_0194442332 /NCGR_PEP_ID=MMETSP0176-20130528/126066_1 /TAXON_ID=216777 /ORGANISM="Proboscia alata, Strain PI-D3" /LENGTH=232 /DNA_ID=CAMNT_0039268409 /DNA_START=185 /DNA_END=883 /DNA_ORIENTATION=+
MKPDWDKLMTEFADSATGLVADVDCTAAGKSLCETHGVKGYPTIKWGDPAALEDYQGGRDFDSLQKFASESLKPMCSPNNIDLCDDEKKAEIEKVQAMSDEELAGAITKDPAALEDYQGGRDFDALQKFASESLKPMCSPNNIDLCDDEKKAEIEKVQAMSDEELAGAITKFEDMNNSAEETFKTEVQKLQDTYQALMKAKDDAVEEVKAAGLGLMKSVQSSKAKAAGNSEL